MILCDTGIFVAAINKADKDHIVSATFLRSLRERLVTTWPCMTEAAYLLQTQVGGWAHDILRSYIDREAAILHTPIKGEGRRAFDLMHEYADTPMDFADASLVVAAETLGIKRILTLDKHFYAYRINGRTPFDVVS